jgi:hypothetical protein
MLYTMSPSSTVRDSGGLGNETHRNWRQRLLRIAGSFIVLGLILELISLLWFHPLSFDLFMFFSVPLIGLGVLIFLVWLVLSLYMARRSVSRT